MNITTIMVQCATTFGTAFAVDGGTVVSAHHVFLDSECAFIGHNVETISSVAKTDTYIGRSTDEPAPVSIPYSCERLKYREVYTLIGSKATTYAVAENKYVDANMDGVIVRSRAMFGEVFPGQSGGPVVDDDGRARAIISAGDGHRLVTVVELADTPICNR